MTHIMQQIEGKEFARHMKEVMKRGQWLGFSQCAKINYKTFDIPCTYCGAIVQRMNPVKACCVDCRESRASQRQKKWWAENKKKSTPKKEPKKMPEIRTCAYESCSNILNSSRKKFCSIECKENEYRTVYLPK